MNLIRILGAFASCCVLFALPATAQQRPWPNRPIHIVSPFPPGGSVTAVARVLGEKLSQRLGQPVVIENKGGGSTSIGTEFVVKSPPDGHTLLLGAATLVLFPYQIPTPYDVTKDLAAIGTVGVSDLILVVHPSVPARNLQELLALAKAKPGELNYATSGAGGLTHLAMEQLGLLTGTKFKHIPYKGAGGATTDLLGGQVQLAFQTPVAVLQHIQAGRLRALAYTGGERMKALPDVPTFREAGVPNFQPRTWYGLLAPAGTPRVIVDRLAAEMAQIAAMPDVIATLAAQGIEPFVTGPDAFATLIRADYAGYGRLVKDAKLDLSN